MLIGNVNISAFKAFLMSRNIESAGFEIFNSWEDNSITPLFFKYGKNKFKKLTLKLDIVCNNANELEIMKSNLIDKLKISTIKFNDIDLYYRGFLSSAPKYDYIVEGNETVEIEMLVVAEKQQIIEEVNRVTTKTLNVTGNTETPAIVEIIPTSDLIDIRLEGLADDPIVIKNLSANKKIIVDGELQKITVDGKNKYADTDMWDFPSLKPGANTITVSRNSCDIKIKYKPRYI
ncbi:phage distal tail protein [uncultured Clostridium sp.]|uniref:phage distal tail protein n=1 Tax=uncultured Clostridium sp. TaxID=59620 RepID=UPI00262BC2F7|nr:phage tail domain-containing protein [uncultured Clostridium sp.]